MIKKTVVLFFSCFLLTSCDFDLSGGDDNNDSNSGSSSPLTGLQSSTVLGIPNTASSSDSVNGVVTVTNHGNSSGLIFGSTSNSKTLTSITYPICGAVSFSEGANTSNTKCEVDTVLNNNEYCDLSYIAKLNDSVEEGTCSGNISINGELNIPVNIEFKNRAFLDLPSLEVGTDENNKVYRGSTINIKAKNISTTESIYVVNLNISDEFKDIINLDESTVQYLGELEPGEDTTFTIKMKDSTEAVEWMFNNALDILNNNLTGNLLSLSSPNSSNVYNINLVPIVFELFPDNFITFINNSNIPENGQYKINFTNILDSDINVAGVDIPTEHTSLLDGSDCSTKTLSSNESCELIINVRPIENSDSLFINTYYGDGVNNDLASLIMISVNNTTQISFDYDDGDSGTGTSFAKSVTDSFNINISKEGYFNFKGSAASYSLTNLEGSSVSDSSYTNGCLDDSSFNDDVCTISISTENLSPGKYTLNVSDSNLDKDYKTEFVIIDEDNAQLSVKLLDNIKTNISVIEFENVGNDDFSSVRAVLSSSRYFNAYTGGSDQTWCSSDLCPNSCTVRTSSNSLFIDHVLSQGSGKCLLYIKSNYENDDEIYFGKSVRLSIETSGGGDPSYFYIQLKSINSLYTVAYDDSDSSDMFNVYNVLDLDSTSFNEMGLNFQGNNIEYLGKNSKNFDIITSNLSGSQATNVYFLNSLTYDSDYPLNIQNTISFEYANLQNTPVYSIFNDRINVTYFDDGYFDDDILNRHIDISDINNVSITDELEISSFSPNYPTLYSSFQTTFNSTNYAKLFVTSGGVLFAQNIPKLCTFSLNGDGNFSNCSTFEETNGYVIEKVIKVLDSSNENLFGIGNEISSDINEAGYFYQAYDDANFSVAKLNLSNMTENITEIIAKDVIANSDKSKIIIALTKVIDNKKLPVMQIRDVNNNILNDINIDLDIDGADVEISSLTLTNLENKVFASINVTNATSNSENGVYIIETNLLDNSYKIHSKDTSLEYSKSLFYTEYTYSYFYFG